MNGNYHFRKVLYEETDQRNVIRSKLIDIVRAYSLAEKDEITERTWLEFVQDAGFFAWMLRNELPVLKNSAFSEELEWRLYINMNKSNINAGNENDSIVDYEENLSLPRDYSNGFRRLPMQFRATQSSIISYFDISFDAVKNDFLKEIVIGPKCGLTEFDIRVLLQSNDFNDEGPNVRKAKASYR